jgi:hypothetical protein
LDRGVLYLADEAVPWTGLVSVDEKEAGSVDAEHYFDGRRLAVTQETGDFGATVSAYTYPEVFGEYNGYSERETYQRFGFSYRTQYADGYKLHIVYNALITPNDRGWRTVKSTVDPSLFAWDVSTSAVPIPNASPASRLTIEIGANDAVLSTVEDILYGTDTEDPRLPDPYELYELYESATVLRILYNGDGTYTAIGPDSMVRLLADGLFEIEAPTVFLGGHDIFTVSSY